MKQNIIGEEKAALEQLLTTATQQLSETIASFSDTSFSQVPFEGSWTAAQVSEHVLKSLDGINGMVNAPTQSTTRNPELYVNDLRKMMEDFNMKAKSAPNLLPGTVPITKVDMQNRLLLSRHELVRSIKDLDLSETCICFEFPGIGYLTRIELISFAAFHTRRHIQQMKNIQRIIDNSKVPRNKLFQSSMKNKTT